MLLKRSFSQINLSKLLSEENRKKTLEKFKKYTKLRFGESNPDKHAAILIPMCIVNNEISILYTIRSSKLRNYSGQVCFPGEKSFTFTF
jgi:nudix motif 8